MLITVLFPLAHLSQISLKFSPLILSSISLPFRMFADKPSEVLNENQADNKSKETKSRRKSKKQAGSNSVARDKEHGYEKK